MGEGSGILIRRNNELVGFAGLCVRQLCDGQSDLSLAHGLDYMVDPSMNGLSGRYALLLAGSWADHARVRKFELGVVYPNQTSMRMLTSKRLGWRPTLFPALLIRPLEGGGFDESPFKYIPLKVLNTGVGAIMLYSNIISSFSKVTSLGQVDEIESYDQRFDDFWLRIKKSNKLIINQRDAAYLNWRYTNHPIYDYIRYAYVQDGEVRGIIIACKRKLLGAYALLVTELLVENDDILIMNILLKSIQEYGSKNGCCILGTQAVKGSSLYNAYKRGGFIEVPRKVNPKSFVMTTQDFTSSNPRVMDADNWYFSWGDMDTV